MTQPSRASKRPSPLSIRMAEAEWQKLRSLAGETPLSAYIKGIVFDTRPKNTAASALLLARSLALLGSSELTGNITVLAEAARSGSLLVDDTTKAKLHQACDDVQQIRLLLMQGLGKRPDGNGTRP